MTLAVSVCVCHKSKRLNESGWVLMRHHRLGRRRSAELTISPSSDARPLQFVAQTVKPLSTARFSRAGQLATDSWYLYSVETTTVERWEHTYRGDRVSGHHRSRHIRAPAASWSGCRFSRPCTHRRRPHWPEWATCRWLPGSSIYTFPDSILHTDVDCWLFIKRQIRRNSLTDYELIHQLVVYVFVYLFKQSISQATNQSPTN